MDWLREKESNLRHGCQKPRRGHYAITHRSRLLHRHLVELSGVEPECRNHPIVCSSTHRLQFGTAAYPGCRPARLDAV